MSILEAIILGIVQGISEFLPVSSSGHLQIAKALLGVHIEDNLTFDVALHAGTVVSTLVVLRSEIVALISGIFRRPTTPQQQYAIKLIISMIPIGIVGLLFKDNINDMLASPYILIVVGAMLLLTATLLAFAYYARPRAKGEISYRDSFIIGLSQAAAAMPGLSRSGSTIATGLLLGSERSAVAQFSFLMVLAPIMGQTLLEILSGEITASVDGVAIIAGFLSSLITGIIACKFMLAMVKRGKLIWFAIYCLVAGSISIISYFI